MSVQACHEADLRRQAEQHPRLRTVGLQWRERQASFADSGLRIEPVRCLVAVRVP